MQTGATRQILTSGEFIHSFTVPIYEIGVENCLRYLGYSDVYHKKCGDSKA